MGLGTRSDYRQDFEDQVDLKRIELVQIDWFTTKAQSGCHRCKQGEETTVVYFGIRH